MKRDMHQKNRGFTLIELGILTLVSGLMMLGVTSAYQNYITQHRVTETRDNIQDLNTLIVTYRAITGAYPCPSNPRLGPDDLNFGREECGTASIVTTQGQRDTDADANPDADPIYIGAVPLISIREAFQNVGLTELVPMSLMVDGWGGKYKYAVSAYLTSAFNNGPLPGDDLYAFNRGVIRAEDEFSEPVAGMQNNDGEDNAHYVLISHGPDQFGAFTMEGAELECPGTVEIVTPNPIPGEPPIVSQEPKDGDTENCDDNDGIFRQVPYQIKGDLTSSYDDFTYFQKIATEELWENIFDVDLQLQTNHITNTNIGNVGVNTDTPEHTFTVEARDPDDEGILRLDNNARFTFLCTTENPDTDCFRIESFTGTEDLVCPDGFVLRGAERITDTLQFSDFQADPQANDEFGRLEPICTPVAFLNEIPSFNCPAGSYVNGLTTNGEVCCVRENPDDSEPNIVECSEIQ